METWGFTLLENAERSSECSKRQHHRFGKGAGNLNEDETDREDRINTVGFREQKAG